MNMTTLKQELRKKIAKMNPDDFNDFIDELYHMYFKVHKYRATIESDKE